MKLPQTATAIGIAIPCLTLPTRHSTTHSPASVWMAWYVFTIET